ncbi:MAG: aminotransferase class IV [Flavobacteriia bacterium]|nr:aminotransferase class IV [Flavobacteriia bacterium]
MRQQFNPKNANIQIWVGDRLYPRNEAKVSVFDSSVQGGDAVWEGLRVYKHGILHLDKHLNRLEHSAKALAFEDIPSREFIHDAIRNTLAANGMNDAAHIRLTLTRGEKVTSSMDPRVNENGSTLIVLAEHKDIVFDNTKGITAITSAIRRNAPQFLDSKIHHNNLLNNIQAKIQSIVAGVDCALMLDENGFAAEFHDVNLFCIIDGVIHTPHADACLPGITRNHAMRVATDIGLPMRESRLSLSELYSCEALFSSGTMGELTPVVELDGRKIPNAANHPIFQKLRDAFNESIPQHCTVL